MEENILNKTRRSIYGKHPLHDEIVMRINESGQMRQIKKNDQYSFHPIAISCYNKHHSKLI